MSSRATLGYYFWASPHDLEPAPSLTVGVLGATRSQPAYCTVRPPVLCLHVSACIVAQGHLHNPTADHLVHLQASP